MIGHPECGHDVSHGPDLYDVECCICAGNPCQAVTVELMARHRDFDIDLWTQPREVSFAPPF